MSRFNNFIFAFLFILTTLLSFHFLTETAEKGAEGMEEKTGALEALNFWTRSRAYPQKDIPKDKFFKAFIHLKKERESRSVKTEGTSPWRAMGPLNVPGRTISLAVNPQNSKTLFAGAATGGLWRTYDDTHSWHWQRIDTGFPTLGVMAIAIDPGDSNTIYIGTGETYGAHQSLGGYVVRTTRGSYGIGILKTTDGGKTWTKSLDWTFDQQRGVEDIAINPKNSSTIFAATSVGIYRTYNGGENWEKVLNVEMGEDIIINPSDTNKILVSSGNLGSADAGIYRSTDGGSTWVKSNDIPYFTGKTLMDYYAANPDIVYASVADSLEGKGLYKTTDFGNSWTLINDDDVPRYQGFFAHWVAIHPTDSKQIVYAGVNIFKSTDGGYHFSSVGGTHVDHHNYAHDPNNPNILYIACDGGVYRSINFGSSYVNIGGGLQTSQFYNGFSCSYSDSNLALGGLQDNNTVIYRGNKKNWKRVIGGDGSWSAVNSVNDNIIYGSWQYDNIQRSKDRGNSFTDITNGLYGDAAFIAPYVISESNPNILYTGRTRVFKTTNGGDSWEAVSNDLDRNQILSMAVYSKNPDIVLVATAPIHRHSHIYKTTDGGGSWLNITGNLPDRYPMDVAIDPAHPNVFYVVYGGYGSGHVFKSTNYGVSWMNITHTLEDVPTLSIAIDPVNTDYIYVGNDLGVFVSSDGGANWNTYSDGLPYGCMAMDLRVSVPDRSLWVATHGNGAYKRSLLFQPDFYITVGLLNFHSLTLVGKKLTFAAKVTNIGTKTQTDDYTMEARLLSPEGVEVYKNTQTFCCLNAGGSKTINFDGGYTPQAPGYYVFQLISKGNSQMPGEDTTRQTIHVIQLPSIANAKVEKIDKPFEFITDGSYFNGDDVQKKVLLPFRFTFDNYTYDKVQISTNGWIEFGTGQDGSLRGLSTSSQIGNIGANQNGSLASTSRPTKVLGPWWEDLNADGSGLVRYTTIGTAPNRTFICQWERMRAYYDNTLTSTRVSFQVRLYETSNKIEFCYGHVERGTFAGPDIGAMIGFKDHIGGDYHFYDIAAGGVEAASDIITDLSPLTDWPGENTAYVIYTEPNDVETQKGISPILFSLSQNFPNPFNPSTTIKYSIPHTSGNSTRAQKVELTVYNSLGQKIATLVNKAQAPGNYIVRFNAKNLPSGVYFYRLRAGNFSATKKMILLK